jgi:tRNA pseudouridine38-40 synthase
MKKIFENSSTFCTPTNQIFVRKTSKNKSVLSKEQAILPQKEPKTEPVLPEREQKDEHNFCLILEYIGTNYCGFQRQKNGLSIQEVLEKAIFEATNERVKTIASGRTDAGVHALSQVVNFHSKTTIPADKLKIVINFHLPLDIKVKKSFEVPLSFNARKSAKQKTYAYKIFTGDYVSVFDVNRVLPFKKRLNIDKMNRACKIIVGTHDFSAFASSGRTTTDCTRTVFSASFTQEGDIVTFEITANGFLYNMVRIIVGTLLEVGTGNLTEPQLKNILRDGNRTKAGRTALACGLYLKQVVYEQSCL